jgi:hypothetical protein
VATGLDGDRRAKRRLYLLLRYKLRSPLPRGLRCASTQRQSDDQRASPTTATPVFPTLLF